MPNGCDCSRPGCTAGWKGGEPYPEDRLNRLYHTDGDAFEEYDERRERIAREVVAMLAKARSPADAARMAVEYADALIAELDK
jgi:hypothetical protein